MKTTIFYVLSLIYLSIIECKNVHDFGNSELRKLDPLLYENDSLEKFYKSENICDIQDSKNINTEWPFEKCNNKSLPPAPAWYCDTKTCAFVPKYKENWEFELVDFKNIDVPIEYNIFFFPNTSEFNHTLLELKYKNERTRLEILISRKFFEILSDSSRLRNHMRLYPTKEPLYMRISEWNENAKILKGTTRYKILIQNTDQIIESFYNCKTLKEDLRERCWQENKDIESYHIDKLDILKNKE